MKKILSNSIFIASITLTLVLNSCKKDNVNSNQVNYGEKLVYITNEGGYNDDNGSISLLEPDSNRITNYVFESANKRSTGDVIQSFGIANRKGYIVANNNNLVKIVNLSTFKEAAEISITYPRYFLEIDTTKAYITQVNIRDR